MKTSYDGLYFPHRLSAVRKSEIFDAARSSRGTPKWGKNGRFGSLFAPFRDATILLPLDNQRCKILRFSPPNVASVGNTRLSRICDVFHGPEQRVASPPGTCCLLSRKTLCKDYSPLSHGSCIKIGTMHYELWNKTRTFGQSPKVLPLGIAK